MGWFITRPSRAFNIESRERVVIAQMRVQVDSVLPAILCSGGLVQVFGQYQKIRKRTDDN